MAGQVFILDRYAYDKKVQNGTIESGSMYIVREPSRENPNMLSLYIGLARQADICDVTHILSVDFSDPDNNYNIPITYQVSDKILLNRDPSGNSYRALVWDADSRRFLNIGSASLTPDEVTILTSQNGVISGVGANVSGKTFTINGSQVTASNGAEIFNYIEGSATNNIATGACSHVEGVSNIECGENNHIEGKGNSILAAGNKQFHIEGYNNNVSGTSNQNVHIEGDSNTFSGSGNSDYSVRGHGNTISAYNTTDVIIDGVSNAITNGGGSSLIIRGQNNTVASNGFNQSEICGFGNTILPSATGNLVYIYGYENEVGSATIAASVNGLHITGRSNKFATGSCVGLEISGNGNTVNGNLMGSTVFGRNNSFSTRGDPVGLFLGGYGNTSDNTSLIRNGASILGSENTFTGGQLDASLVFGTDISVSGTISHGSAIFGSENSFPSSSTVGYSVIFGGSNTVNNAQYSIVGGYGNTVDTQYSAIIGCGLAANSSYIAVFGKYNYLTTLDKSLCIGNGADANSRTNALVLDNLGNLVTAGNIVSGTGASLSTVRVVDTTVSADDSSYTFTVLPRNGSEIILSDTYTIEDISITDIGNMPRADADNYLSGNSTATQARTSDYTSVIIFKKSSNLTNIADALTNFSANDSTKIYLLNPDLDITDYTVIHIMLSYDGFNMTAIAAGYKENPSA